MSKRVIIWTIVALLVAAGLVLSNFGRILPDFLLRDPVFTEEIPSKLPPRLDRRLLERFSGIGVDQIIDTLLAERAANPETLPAPTATGAEKLLASLPDEPLPYPKGSTPSDPETLRQFVTGIQSGSSGEGSKPTSEEIWQFNLALSALEIDLEQIPESLRRDTRPAPESDTFPIKLEDRKADLEAPFCTGDFDGDGKLEIVSSGGAAAHHIDVSGRLVAIQWPSLKHPGDGLFPADYDRDGDLDLFVARRDGLPNSLLRNRGNGLFDDVTAELGLLSFDSTNLGAWIDFDQDGFLDLLVGSEDHPLKLFRQNNLATFEAVAWDLKLWIPRGTRFIEVADVNGDQYPDFYMGIAGLPDRLYINTPSGNPAEWRFHDVAPEIGLGSSSEASPAQFFDFDNDSLPDLATGAGSKLQIFHNEGDGELANVSDSLSLPEMSPLSLAAFDLDNDGFEDLYLGTSALMPNRVLWNREGTGFRDISVTSRGSYLDVPTTMQAGDLDGNGHIDLLYANSSGNVKWLQSSGPIGSWIRLQLINGPAENTRINIVSRDPDWIIRQVPRVMDQNTSLTIGLGEVDQIETLSIESPDGTPLQDPLKGLRPDQTIEIDLP